MIAPNITPGPWLRDSECNVPSGCISVGQEKYSGFEVKTTDNWPVCFLPIYFDFAPSPIHCKNKVELDWDEAYANLTAMAALPELLDLLVRAVNRLEIAHRNGDSIMREWIIDARTALLKAGCTDG